MTRPFERARWVVWHPHQKLWNWRLVGILARIPRTKRVITAVVWADSVFLAARVLARRAERLNVLTLIRLPSLPEHALYVDCGVHREGRELEFMYRCFGGRAAMIGFEASHEHYVAARGALASVPGLDLRHGALVGPSHSAPTVRLYKAGGGGSGDSLFAERGKRFESVRAVRLSEVLREFYETHGDVPTLIRMNIEGAELFVIEDLVNSGLRSKVSGFYGMWDDLSKIDRRKDAEFRQLLRRNGIRTMTFNDRDLGHRLREWAIRYDVTTSLLADRARCSGSKGPE